MKHIKSFESYDIKDIYSWWSGIDVSEDSEYYIIDLKNTYLTNKIMQLNIGLKNKTLEFYCETHNKIEKLKIENIEYNETYGKLIFKSNYYFSKKLGKNYGANYNIHIVDITKPIKISKFHITTDKYNL